MKTIDAKISRVTDNGLAYAASESQDDHVAVVFTFDKIKKYKGEYPKELGLKKGSQVRIKIDTDSNIVKFVEVLKPSHKY